ncbi:MAG TPA: hypothetical protein VF841_17860 [Anaeromyxobacter sp.]
MRRPLALLLAALAAAPAGAAALEPRFDHRDTLGPFAELVLVHDAVARPGQPTASWSHTAVRAGWGFAVSGDGDEILLGGAMSLGWPDDPGRTRVLASADARYRGYFGSEQLKTFFDVGLWVPFRSRLAVGPLVGIGTVWDFSRGAGIYAAASFSTALGEARIASLAISAGAQLRFELP